MPGIVSKSLAGWPVWKDWTGKPAQEHNGRWHGMELAPVRSVRPLDAKIWKTEDEDFSCKQENARFVG